MEENESIVLLPLSAAALAMPPSLCESSAREDVAFRVHDGGSSVRMRDGRGKIEMREWSFEILHYQLNKTNEQMRKKMEEFKLIAWF